MMIKTKTTRIPFDVAEVITTSIENGNQPYLDWIGKIVTEKS